MGHVVSAITMKTFTWSGKQDNVHVSWPVSKILFIKKEVHLQAVAIDTSAYSYNSFIHPNIVSQETKDIILW